MQFASVIRYAATDSRRIIIYEDDGRLCISCEETIGGKHKFAPVQLDGAVEKELRVIIEMSFDAIAREFKK